MDECVFYIAEGDPQDKHSQELMAQCTLIHSSHHYGSWRHADSPRHGSCITGVGAGERVFCAHAKKALIEVYSWGKEGCDQKIPVPEAIRCLAVVHHPAVSGGPLPKYRVPWLLCGGSTLGRLYIWELALGNLLCVKDAHYQPVLALRFLADGRWLVSAGDDARVLVWRVSDLINVYAGGDHDLRQVKPYMTLTDHTMAVTDIHILGFAAVDQRLYTTLRDATCRCYDLTSKQALTTIVAPHPVEALAVDPAGRAVYLGLSEGTIRTVPLYVVNEHTQVLEAVGGTGRIITVPDDPELRSLFVHHYLTDGSLAVTFIDISGDGMNLVTGDSKGRVFVSDIVTRQVIKAYPVLNSPIAEVYVSLIATTEKLAVLGKKHRLIPPLKRVLVSTDPLQHLVYMEIPLPSQESQDWPAWIDSVARVEEEFKSTASTSNDMLSVKTVGTSLATSAKIKAEEELEKMTKAYNELREKHEQLLEQYTESLNE